MNRAILLSGLVCLAVAGGGTAMASPCGAQATDMMRTYGLTTAGSAGPSAAASSGAVNSDATAKNGTPTTKPLTHIQQTKVADFVKQAAAADGRGDMAGCMSNLQAAKTVINQ